MYLWQYFKLLKGPLEDFEIKCTKISISFHVSLITVEQFLSLLPRSVDNSSQPFLFYTYLNSYLTDLGTGLCFAHVAGKRTKP